MPAMTVDYKERVIARIQRDPDYARGLLAEAFNLMAAGETDTARSLLRQLAQARGFEVLAAETGTNAKTLHRQLGETGNPTMAALGAILRALSAPLMRHKTLRLEEAEAA